MATPLSAIWLTLNFIVLPLVLGNMAGPGDITLERIEKCGEDQFGYSQVINMKKLNRTHMGIDVDITTPFDFDGKIALNLTGSKWGDGGWKPNAFNFYDPYACELCRKNFEDKFKTVMTMLNHELVCPIKKGTYIIKDYAFDTDLGIPVLYGKYRYDLTLEKEGVTFSCARLYTNQEPKKML